MFLSSYDRTLEAIATIRKSGMHCAIMSTISAANIDEIPELIDVIVEHKTDIFAFGAIVRLQKIRPTWIRGTSSVCGHVCTSSFFRYPQKRFNVVRW